MICITKNGSFLAVLYNVDESVLSLTLVVCPLVRDVWGRRWHLFPLHAMAKMSGQALVFFLIMCDEILQVREKSFLNTLTGLNRPGVKKNR